MHVLLVSQCSKFQSVSLYGHPFSGYQGAKIFPAVEIIMEKSGNFWKEKTVLEKIERKLKKNIYISEAWFFFFHTMYIYSTSLDHSFYSKHHFLLHPSTLNTV